MIYYKCNFEVTKDRFLRAICLDCEIEMFLLVTAMVKSKVVETL
jgi:hypothetical protein